MRGLLEEPTDGSGSSPSIGGTVSGGTTNSVLFINPTAVLSQDNANFSFTDDSTLLFQVGSVSTLGQAITKIKGGVLGGASAQDNFWNLTGTLPAVTSAGTNGININVTSAGSSSQQQRAMVVTLNAGYTGSSATQGMNLTNNAAGTATAGWTGATNSAFLITSAGTTAGNNNGSISTASGSSSLNLASLGRAIGSGNTPALNVGMGGLALNATVNVAGFFGLMNAAPTLGSSSALIADNGAVAADIFEARDNGSVVVSIVDGGQLQSTISTLTPTVIGGTAVGSSLTLQSTSGVGTTDFIKFNVGNNGGTEAMRVVDSGAVGIGTSSPTAVALSVFNKNSSNTATTFDARFDNNGVFAGSAWENFYGQFELANRNQTNGNVEYFSFSGHPTSGFSSAVIGTVNVDHSTYEGDLFFWTRNSAGTGATKMIIKGGGNVGIGTTTPGSILQLNGGLSVGYSASQAAPTNGLIVSGHLTLEGVTSTGATGTGKFVFDTSPTLVTPVLGVATATSINKVTITQPASSATLTIADGKTISTAFNFTTTGADISMVGSGTAVYSYIGETSTISGIVSNQRATAQTAAKALTAYTVGASDASFMVSANVLVTTSTVHSFTVTCTYTDEGNTSRILTLPFQLLAGTSATSITNAQGAVPYEGTPLHIRAKAGTTIQIASASGGTYTTVTYNLEGIITRVG